MGPLWSRSATASTSRTLGLWCMDLAKQLALGAVILPPCVAAFTMILQHTSAAMVLYLWAFVFGLQLFFMTVCAPPHALISLWFGEVGLAPEVQLDPAAAVGGYLWAFQARLNSHGWPAAVFRECLHAPQGQRVQGP